MEALFDFFVNYFEHWNIIKTIECVIILMIILARIKITYFREAPAKWQQVFRDFHHSPNDFYELIRDKLKEEKIPRARRFRRVLKSEGGMFSPRRYYLRIWRKMHCVYIGATPFGNSMIFSCWLHVRVSLLRLMIFYIPFVGEKLHSIFWKRTFYVKDTETAFFSIVHGVLLEAVDEITKAGGARQMTEDERKPTVQDIFAR